MTNSSRLILLSLISHFEVPLHNKMRRISFWCSIKSRRNICFSSWPHTTPIHYSLIFPALCRITLSTTISLHIQSSSSSLASVPVMGSFLSVSFTDSSFARWQATSNDTMPRVPCIVYCYFRHSHSNSSKKATYPFPEWKQKKKK